MEDDEIQRVRVIQASMEESARPGFDDKDIENLGILIRLAVEFHNFLRLTPSWSPLPDDRFYDLMYTIDSILIQTDSFRALMHSYSVLVGSTRSTLDPSAISVQSLKDCFLSKYNQFNVETKFENKCRLLLDLFKLQLLFAGAFYDCRP